MKKIILALFLFFVFLSNISASSTYSINIPSEFTSTKDNYYEQETENNKTSIYIYTSDNKEQININNYNNTSIKNTDYIKKLKEYVKTSNQNYSIDVSKIEIGYINNYKAIIMDITSSTKLDDDNKSIVYQRQYVTSSKNHIYYVTFSSSNKEYIGSVEMNSVLSSFKINDELLEKTYNFKKYYIVLTVLVLLGPVIGFIFHKRKI